MSSEISLKTTSLIPCLLALTWIGSSGKCVVSYPLGWLTVDSKSFNLKDISLSYKTHHQYLCKHELVNKLLLTEGD